MVYKRSCCEDPATIATTLSGYFVNIMQTIGLKQFQFDHANHLFEDHTSIIRIKSNLDMIQINLILKKCMRKLKKNAMVLYQPKFLKNFATHFFP